LPENQLIFYPLVLKIEISSLKPGENRIATALSKEDFRPDIAANVSGGSLDLTVDNRDESLYFTGQMTVTLDLECSRCLKKLTRELDLPFSFVAREKAEGDDEDVDLNVVPYEAGDKEIDLSPPLSEEVAVNTPMAPVCREDCRGFCPVCGGNRNKKACSCKEEARNPVWDELLKLKRRP